MYDDILKNLISALDKEYEAYENLKELFEQKKQLLIKAKPDDLVVLDNQIVALNNTIIKLSNSRKNISEELLGKNGCMSDFISFAAEHNSDYEEPLASRKIKICKILEDLALLNNQNVELIKHGMVITDKMLETIIDAFAPQGSNYNGAGKTDSHDLDMWTINEEI